MRHTVTVRLALGAIVALAAAGGCDLLKSESDQSPTAPSSTTSSLEPFVGTFTSTSTTAPSPTSCTNVRYVVTPTSLTTATVTFSATCAGDILVAGNGSGTLSGTTLHWNAQGTVTQGAITCPFSFPGGTATPEGTGSVRINYSGTICGISVSGSEVVRKS